MELKEITQNIKALCYPLLAFYSFIYLSKASILCSYGIRDERAGPQFP
jgi:hypothetical protein